MPVSYISYMPVLILSILILLCFPSSYVSLSNLTRTFAIRKCCYQNLSKSSIVSIIIRKRIRFFFIL